jgi:agmatinase
MSPEVAIIPVPYEQTTSYGKGAKYGPAAVIAALKHVEDYDIEEDKVVDRASIKILPALKNINTYQKLYEEVGKITNKVLNSRSLPIYLGGEHTITAAIVSALRKKFVDFTILHFDAHSDLRDTYGGVKYSHACVMRRIFEMGLAVVSIGVRSQCLEERKFIKKEGINIFYAHDILKSKDWMDSAINLLQDKVYLTFDVDVMDPSCVKATGTPEPGGLDWQLVVDFFRTLAKRKKQIIGMDVVELAPIKGDYTSDFLCAKLLYKILAFFL